MWPAKSRGSPEHVLFQLPRLRRRELLKAARRDLHGVPGVRLRIAAIAAPAACMPLSVLLGGFWYVTVFVAAMLILFWASLSLQRMMWRALRPHLIAAGICLGCGYDLTGNTSGVCPECGTAVPAEA